MDAAEDKAVWNIFEAPDETIASVYKQDVEYKTSPTLLSNGNTQTMTGSIRMFTRDLDAWLLPSEARLRVVFHLALTDPPVLVGQEIPFTLINGGFNLFSDIEIKLNGNVVDHIDHPGKVQLMHGYASYSSSYVNQSGDLEWFYPEHAVRLAGDLTGTGTALGTRRLTGFANPRDLKSIGIFPFPLQSSTWSATAAKENPSYLARYNRTRDGKQVELFLPLSAVSGFCRDTNKVIRGMTMEVTLNRNTEWGSILHSTQRMMEAITVSDSVSPELEGFFDNMRAIVDEVSLWIPSLKPSLQMASEIEQQLVHNAKTKWYFTNMTTYQSDRYQYSTSNVRWQITTTNRRPLVALIGAQGEFQVNRIGDRRPFHGPSVVANLTYAPLDPYPRTITRAQHSSSNGGIFSSLGNITSMEFRVNGHVVYNEAYKLDFLRDQYARAYYDFKRLYHKDNPQESSIMDYESYGDSPIMAFDLRAIDDPGIYDMTKENNLELRAVVSSAAAGADSDLTDHEGGSGDFTFFCVLISEKVAAVEAKGGRLNII